MVKKRSLPIQGFTLMELVVVISVVSIIIAALIVVMNPITQFKKGRDSQRRSTLKQLQTAIEQYYDDNGTYPTTVGAYFSSDPTDSYNNNNGNWIPGITPKYMQTLPSDPSGGNATCAPLTGTKRAYIYRSDGFQYALISCGPEISAGLNNPKDSMYDPAHPTTAWKVCIGDTACNSW